MDRVSATFAPGKVTALIGPNAAGKTTLFHIVCGTVPPDTGEVYVEDRRVDGLPAWEVANLGVGRLFQDVRCFPRLAALENVMTGCRRQLGENPLAALFLCGAVSRAEKANREKSLRHLGFVGLADKALALAQDLSYGEQKLVAIARMLAGESTALLLDEPTAGVHVDMAHRIMRLLRELAGTGRTVVVIEHNMEAVLQYSDWVYLMDRGRIVSFGLPQEIIESREMSKAFFLKGSVAEA